MRDRLAMIYQARMNPCPDGEHDYEDMVNAMGKATMLNQVCKICFDVQGWIYNWSKED